jgi:muconate cycloisomerase
MSKPLPVAALSMWQLGIPLRHPFRHAAASRTAADPIIVGLELADGTMGYGETHPRPYVTGESHQDVLRTIKDLFVPLLVDIRPGNFGEALEVAANLPMKDRSDRVIAAARAAVELALLDAYARTFGRSLAAIAGWIGESWLGLPGSHGSVRYSGVISAADPKGVGRSIRVMRLAGLRDFKLKVGDEGDEERVAVAVKALGKGLARGRTSLRLDANGAWTVEQARHRLEAWRGLPIACVEQPLAKTDEAGWATLAKGAPLPLMADESLVTADDAARLAGGRYVTWFNIRISKNGGLIPAIQLAVIARRHNIQCQLGCMVGETSILSAAGRWFLRLVPKVRFAEGSFGRFLLHEDVTAKSVRFGFGGRWKPLEGPGLGVLVEPRRLERLAVEPPTRLPF